MRKTVSGNCKTMGFLLNIPNQRKDGLIHVNANLLPLRSHQRPGTVPVVFNHSKYRETQIQLLKSAQSRLCVDCTSVNQQQIRGGLKSFIAGKVVGETSDNHLTHGRVIVLIGHLFNPETLIC